MHFFFFFFFFFFLGGGGVTYIMWLHVNAATLRGLTSFILCLIKCSFRKS